MREEEKTNPRVLPPYKPWWAVPEEIAPVSVIETMKVAELKLECEKLGVSSKGKKDELLQLLRETKALYDLSDANFRQVMHFHLLLVSLLKCVIDSRPFISSCSPCIVFNMSLTLAYL